MLHWKVKMNKRVFFENEDRIPFFDLYKHERAIKDTLILVLPGGGYFFCNPREGEDVAYAFLSKGFDAAVLNYSTEKGDFYPKQLKEVALAVDYIRKNYGYKRVILCGFSAGGHLAASLATSYDKEDAVKDFDCRPDGCILSYPVLISGEYENKITLDNLCGADSSLREWVSLEKRIDENTPPFFIWHTYEDEKVPVENSLIFALYLRKKNVPMELHIYEKGLHALSLATEITAEGKEEINIHASTWFDTACDWVNNCL